MTVVSYECTGAGPAATRMYCYLVKAFVTMMCILFIAGVDYVPVNVTLTFTGTTTSHTVDIVTIDDRIYEADGESEAICLRMTNLIEPCPDYVSIGNDAVVPIEEDDSKLPMYVCTSYIHVFIQFLHFGSLAILIQLAIASLDGPSMCIILFLQYFLLLFYVH